MISTAALRFGKIILLVGVAALSAAAQSGVTTPGGTANAVPKFSDSSTLVSSAITESSGRVGIGGDPSGQDSSVTSPAVLLVQGTSPSAHIRLNTTQVNNSYTDSQEAIDFFGPGNTLVGSISGLNADYPGAGVY